MSAIVDFAPHDFGRDLLLDARMARPPHHGYDDGYVPRHGHYAQESHFSQQPQQQQQPSPPQLTQQPRLPPMAAMIPTPGPNHSPLPYGRDSQYAGGRGGYYSDYATPSPIGQTPPQFPGPNNDPHALSRRAVDLRRSPTLSSTASDRSSDEMAHEIRMRQMNSFHHQPQGQIPRAPYAQQSPHFRGDPYHHDNALPPVMMGGGGSSSSSYSPAGPMPILNGHSSLPQSPPSTQSSASPRQEAKSMSISNLLSSESSSSAANPNSPHHNLHNKSPNNGYNPNSKAPMPTLPSPRPLASPTSSSSSSEYRISVRQQPYAARSCGFGERDRRVIDPPPIVQLTITDSSLSQEELGRRLRHQFSVVHCSIWDEQGQKDMSSMPEDFRQQRRLMGTLVASPFVGLDENGEEGCFFCFPDLSCRTPGVFRLKFALVVLDPAKMCTGEKSPIVATGMSEAFQVYNAKDFPGMKASTALTKRLKEQGCLISIKKGNDSSSTTVSNGKRGGSKGKDLSSLDDVEEGVDSDEDDVEGVRVRKRAKRSL
ncbi:velvet factor-domain-containing protein [Cladorrhinum sp. PSN259]|nr:velvet factor-domain-containing protein [Cladorrhinum sp. PSN259]